MKNNVPKIFTYVLLFVAIVMQACGASVASSGDGYDSAPSNTFIIEAGSGTEGFLSTESNSGEIITNTADFFTVFYSTNKVKNNLNVAGEKNYDKAHAFILESPHWSKIPGQTIATSEVGLGMTGDLMRSLGLTPGQPTYLPREQVANLINSGAMSLNVCSFTQCNSGELFYFAMMSYYSGKNVMDFSLIDGSPESQAVLQQTQNLVQKINITTSTDEDAKNKFLENTGEYNAIWTYEPEVAQINFTRVSQGLEPIYMVYVDGTIDAAVTLFFSPYYQLTEEDKTDPNKVDSYKAILDDYNTIAAAFEKDEAIRKAIADSGWRPAQYGATPSPEVLRAEWGFVLEPQTSTSFAPKYEVAEALNKTYTIIRKPSILIYVDDDSGSMSDPFAKTTGRQQLIEASYFMFGPESETEFLNATDPDITSVYMFDDDECRHLGTVEGTQTLVLAQQIESTYLAGNTSMFRCGLQALTEMSNYKSKCETTHKCAIVYMTDGVDNDCPNNVDTEECITANDFNLERTRLGLDFIGVYAIPVGSANLNQINQINNVNVCEDAMISDDLMIDCFKKIKGVN